MSLKNRHLTVMENNWHLKTTENIRNLTHKKFRRLIPKVLEKTSLPPLTSEVVGTGHHLCSAERSGSSSL